MPDGNDLTPLDLPDGVTQADLGNDEVNLADHGIQTRENTPAPVLTTEEQERRKAVWMKKIRTLYDSFEVKDMPFEKFVDEMKTLTSPEVYQEDLRNLMARRTTAKQLKDRIGAAVRSN